MLTRRNWLRQSILTSAGAALLAPNALQALSGRQASIFDRLATTNTDEGYWELVKEQFSFAPGLTYFNNGSLGACPDHVVAATNTFRQTLDGFPSKYMWGGWEIEKETVRKKVAEMFSVSPETIALIHNTTEGMNLIASSMDLAPGDEVLLSSHEHTSARVPWKYWQESKGVVLKDVELPLIPESKEEIVDLFRQAITPKTKVISIVHVTNTNGMMLPVKEISAMAHEHGVLVAVDGAQSMGMFRINLDELGCDFFTSSSHKWLFSPKGMGIFYAREESQSLLKPLIVCRGWENKTIRRLENYNTRNLPELLGLGAALDFRNLIGQERIERRVFELKHYLLSLLPDETRFACKTPVADDLSAGIQTIEVIGKSVGDVRDELRDKHGIDCRPMSTHNINGVRISLAIYCTNADVEDLAKALGA
ncbi:MAG: aminotransferase class V-fold PLP-dependent enzyme [Lewinella sp.]